MKIANLDKFKSNEVLGGLNIIIEKCKNDNNFLKETKTLGDEYFKNEKKLNYPFNIILGIAFKANEYLKDDNNLKKASLIGSKIFEEYQNKKLEKYNYVWQHKKIKK